MATATAITVEEFERLLETTDRRLELHDGEVVEVAVPKMRQLRTVYRIEELVRPIVSSSGLLRPEFPLRVGTEFRTADLAWCPWSRLSGIGDDEWLRGALDWVIEVV